MERVKERQDEKESVMVQAQRGCSAAGAHCKDPLTLFSPSERKEHSQFA